MNIVIVTDRVDLPSGWQDRSVRLLNQAWSRLRAIALAQMQGTDNELLTLV